MRKIRKGESYALSLTIDNALNTIKRSPLRCAHLHDVVEEVSERLRRDSVPRNDDDNGRNVLLNGRPSRRFNPDDDEENSFWKLPDHVRLDYQDNCPKNPRNNYLFLRIVRESVFNVFKRSFQNREMPTQKPRTGKINVTNNNFLSSILQVCCLFFICVLFSDAQAQSGRTLGGEVRSAADGQTIEGVSVQAGNKYTLTDKEGRFTITVADAKGVLKIYHIGYAAQTVAYDETTTSVEITLQPSENQIEEVEVVSTGYQRIPKERATGSFEFVDSALFNRKVSTDFVSRLEDVVPSISSNKTYAPNRGRYLGINIRGESTMRSEFQPLVVIDGVPYPNNFDSYTGNFNNINPNDVESVTVLKDAAASSIWGAQSGNGVIVITTKRGKYNQPFQLSVNSNVTVGQKPDLYYYPQMNTSDYIDLEKQLFDAGYWDSRMNEYYVNLTPAIQLLKRHREDDISDQELNRELDALRGVDMREDFLKYVYRESVNQQYSVQLRGGGEKINTAFSVGYDNNRDNLVTSSFSRFTVKNNTQLRPIKNLTLDIGVTYTESRHRDSELPMGYNLMGRGEGNFPYMRMADEMGNPLIVDAIGNNPIFRDTIAGGRLLDWKYRPVAELHETHNITNVRETFLNLAANYKIFPSLKVSGLYAYLRGSQPMELWRGIGSSHQRELINYHASWDDQAVTWNLPVGDYLNTLHRNNSSQQGRLVLDFTQKWGEHDLTAIAGSEIRQVNSDMMSSVFWGYDRETMAYQSVKLGAQVPALNGIAGTITLMDHSQNGAFINRYVSYFSNAAYTYSSRYTVSGSVRKDASNLFGVRTNDRGQPFWSIGGSWLLSNEDFVNSDWFPMLKLRATYGYNGNVNNSVSAYPIINISSQPNTITGQNFATISAPPNPSLRWERVGMLNFGLDFAIKGNRLSGAVEYYIKRPKDLIAGTQVDPTTGFTTLNINSADLDGRGVDVSLNAINLQNDVFNWTTNLVFAYNRTRVKRSFVSNDRARNYVFGPHSSTMTPFEGKDIYSILAYQWAGLDPEDGTPRGFLNGDISKDYGALVNQSSVNDLAYMGSARPLFFGSLRNSFRFKMLEFSFNMAYNMGHKFRRSSFDNRYFIDQGVGHADYSQRWQKPGDEQLTDVPAFTYPNNLFASDLYYYSSVLIEDASWVKLRDIQLSYSLAKLNNISVKNARVYLYAQHLGMLWRANGYDIDPEFGKVVPDPFTLSLGLTFNL